MHPQDRNTWGLNLIDFQVIYNPKLKGIRIQDRTQRERGDTLKGGHWSVAVFLGSIFHLFKCNRNYTGECGGK